MARLSISLLGLLQVNLEGAPVSTFKYNKAKALFAYLVVEADRPHSRESLAGLLWPDLPEDVAHKNLSQALSNLRQAIGDQGTPGPFLLITYEIIQFNPASDHELDLALFSGLLAACDAHAHRSIEGCTACAGRLGQAAALYRDDFLAHFSPGDSAPFEEWAQARREALRQRALRALAQLAAYHERHANYEQASLYARRQLELDPWREAAHRQVMRLLALDGQRNAALAHYDSLRRTLAKELDAPPEQETTALYERLRGADHNGVVAAGDGARLHKFPARLEPFIGRDQELAEIAALIEQPTCRLITLVGPGGMGKTRLAIQAAEQHAAMFASGAYFVPLAPLASAEFVVAAITAALEVHIPAATDPRHQLLNFLRQKELLLVLDSAEHLLAEQQPEASLAGLVGDILEQAPGVSLLVASRERLRLTGERVLAVPGLEEPPPGAIDRLGDFDAVQLFVECARRADPALALTAEEAPSVVRICHSLAGMPLGIEMAAAWVRVISCAEIAMEIEHDLDFLQAPSRDVPERHRSLRAVFDHAWRLLSGDERQVFANLSVFQGGFEREAAEQVAGATLPILSALADKSLLQRTAAGRYDLHGLLRQFALARLAASGVEDATRGRHAHYYCSLGETVTPLLRTREQRRGRERLEAELGNLRAALAWSQTVAGDVEVGLRLASALGEFWELMEYLNEGRAWLAGGLARGDTVPAPVRAKALYQAGQLAFAADDNLAARQHFEAGLLMSRTIGYTWAIASSLAGLGLLAFVRRDDDAAQAMLTESLGLFRQLGDKPGIADQLNRLAMLARSQGDYKGALTQFVECLEVYRQAGDPMGIAIATYGLGQVARSQRDDARAAIYYGESMALLRELGAKACIAEVSMFQGYLARRKGDYVQAKMLFVEALVMSREFGFKQTAAFCMAWMGGMAAVQRRPEASVRLLSAGAALFDAIGKRLGVTEQTEYDRDVAAAREQLDETAFAAAWAEGQAMTMEQAIELTLRT